MDNYEVLGLIGEGSFGRVYKAKCRRKGETVAFKRIMKRGRSEEELKSLRQEFQIQQHLFHPNIIQMIDSFETKNEIVVVTEYAEKELYEILAEEGYLTEEKVHDIAVDLVSALYYLHSHRILHRDLKPQNILLQSNGLAKLCDFGFARSMNSRTHVLTSIKGTPLYMAPEIFDHKPYDHNADLWSLGCIIYELLVGTPPFYATSIVHLMTLLLKEVVKWPEFLSPDCLSFIQGLLEKDPIQRLSWPDLLHHPFLKNRVLILSDTGVTFPLTKRLTASQAVAKEKQKRELETKNAGKSNLITNTLQEYEEYERWVRQDRQQRPGSFSSNKAVKCSGTTKDSFDLVNQDDDCNQYNQDPLELSDTKVNVSCKKLTAVPVPSSKLANKTLSNARCSFPSVQEMKAPFSSVISLCLNKSSDSLPKLQTKQSSNKSIPFNSDKCASAFQTEKHFSNSNKSSLLASVKKMNSSCNSTESKSLNAVSSCLNENNLKKSISVDTYTELKKEVKVSNNSQKSKESISIQNPRKSIDTIGSVLQNEVLKADSSPSFYVEALCKHLRNSKIADNKHLCTHSVTQDVSINASPSKSHAAPLNLCIRDQKSSEDISKSNASQQKDLHSSNLKQQESIVDHHKKLLQINSKLQSLSKNNEIETESASEIHHRSESQFDGKEANNLSISTMNIQKSEENSCKSQGIFTLHSWNSSVDTNPLENEEWLAFLRHIIEEAMDGDVDLLQECSFVGMITSPLRNSTASCKVMEYIACLLSIPFALDEIKDEEVNKIKQVYLETKIVPNLIYASKLLARHKGYDSDDPNLSLDELVCIISDLSADELQALQYVYLLICYLVYSHEDFIIQFCDAVVILNATTLIQQFLLLDRRKLRIVTDLVAILTNVLCTLPENAAIVEQIILGTGIEEHFGIDLSRLLSHHCPILKSRTCILLKLLGRYCCRALHSKWTQRLQGDLENLLQDRSPKVKMYAGVAVKELKMMPFYFKNRVSHSAS